MSAAIGWQTDSTYSTYSTLQQKLRYTGCPAPMKFHCDRCKTKYSISDDRVRGKILKIRCKNCSAVITVREHKAAAKIDQHEGSQATAHNDPQLNDAQHAGQQALAGAFRESVTGPAAEAGGSGASAPPVSLEAEWYLSKDGEQEGPFDLQLARGWVQEKSADDELYCWSEGYDDWLPIDKVSHFRSLRRAPSNTSVTPLPSVTPPPTPQVEDTPQPLFAATMAAVQERIPDAVSANEIVPVMPTPVPTEGPFDAMLGASHGAETPEFLDATLVDEDELDFEIGEASRVVDLPALLAAQRQAQHKTASAVPVRASSVLEAPMDATGPAGTVAASGPPSLEPAVQRPSRRRRKGLLIPLAAAGVLIVGVAIVMIIMMSDDDDGSRVARGTVGGSGNLGYRYSGDQPKTKPTKEPPVVPEPKNNTGGKTGPRIRKNPNGGGGTTLPPIPKRDPNEVDLSGGSSSGPTGPLDGDDLMRVYRKNQIAIKMCYERSLKKDPLLKLPKTWVDIKVGLDGRVTGVSIPSLAGTPLGTCMRSRIARWRFRKTTELFSSRFPVVFDR